MRLSANGLSGCPQTLERCRPAALPEPNGPTLSHSYQHDRHTDVHNGSTAILVVATGDDSGYTSLTHQRERIVYT